MDYPETRTVLAGKRFPKEERKSPIRPGSIGALLDVLLHQEDIVRKDQARLRLRDACRFALSETVDDLATGLDPMKLDELTDQTIMLIEQQKSLPVTWFLSQQSELQNPEPMQFQHEADKAQFLEKIKNELERGKNGNTGEQALRILQALGLAAYLPDAT